MAFGYGLHAFQLAKDRGWACLALAVAGLGLIGWCLLLASLSVVLSVAALGALWVVYKFT